MKKSAERGANEEPTPSPLIKLNPQHPILSSSLPSVFSRGDNMNRPGDWNCRSCQHLNFQRRDSCQRCGEPRPGGERGDYGSFGGRGGSSFGFTGPDVRPGDWYCTLGNCGAHNFASRSSCFKCGAAKDDLSGGFEVVDMLEHKVGLQRAQLCQQDGMFQMQCTKGLHPQIFILINKTEIFIFGYCCSPRREAIPRCFFLSLVCLFLYGRCLDESCLKDFS
ncbi:hypothetical protein V6N12_038874 [Hibiscus sabdariffa]|uniref:RanBP2-type domain-containing protein n=1 Tax=Hibiscus sabdariffa TaxID=183260 RepID=A0ABR2DYZ5_9ROSI